MRVVFMGTPDFSVPTLKAVIEAGHELAAVVTQPDKPKGRSKELICSPVKKEALNHHIQVMQPLKAGDREFIEELRALEADVFVVVAYGQILPKEIIRMPKFGCINVHASLLPKYRGASPVQWAVIDGCEYSGVTTMKMDEGVDTGDILLTEKVKLAPKETGGSLFDKLSALGAALLVDTLEALEAGTITQTPQGQEGSSYVKMLGKSFGLLDFEKDAEVLERLIRGLNPWPSAYAYFGGKMLKIWDADVCGENDIPAGDLEQFSDCACGTIVYVGKNAFYVKCGRNYLKVNEVQLEGKKRMASTAFLHGNEVKAGMELVHLREH